MDTTAVRIFFMWCTIINLGMLIFSSIMCAFLGDFSFKMNSRLFSITREQFNVILVSFLALYKIIFIAFNLVPFVALLIIA
jgi:hypothetical protein